MKEKFKVWFEGNEDKVLHFIVCFAGSLLLGAGFGVGAGLAAEYKDRAWGGKWDWYDILADAIGTLVGGMFHFYIIQTVWQ